MERRQEEEEEEGAGNEELLKGEKRSTSKICCPHLPPAKRRNVNKNKSAKKATTLLESFQTMIPRDIVVKKIMPYLDRPSVVVMMSETLKKELGYLRLHENFCNEHGTGKKTRNQLKEEGHLEQEEDQDEEEVAVEKEADADAHEVDLVVCLDCVKEDEEGEIRCDKCDTFFSEEEMEDGCSDCHPNNRFCDSCYSDIGETCKFCHVTYCECQKQRSLSCCGCCEEWFCECHHEDREFVGYDYCTFECANNGTETFYDEEYD
ncbi:expressed unknown protein [Seminavis robusta]|uniref:Uncharacterized protein n=1 Tax=Seminavis robusta TaxID=568900 RepID=A0A9N8DDR5_9STRA|nr:expressed unknown protein [Seminavis robusta]|eukprot:Sro92_g047980.1 n/a (262) ;mRNA; r:20903-21688